MTRDKQVSLNAILLYFWVYMIGALQTEQQIREHKRTCVRRQNIIWGSVYSPG